jgi:hypothetical protein
MTMTLDGSSGTTFPAGGVGNPASTVVGISDTQTLTNKTLTSPTIGGTPVMSASVITLGTSVSPTTSTSIEFTGLPSWVKRIIVSYQALKSNGTANFWIQLSTGGSYVTTGYAGSLMYTAGASGSSATGQTSAITIFHDTATNIRTGMMTLTLMNAATNTWMANGFCGDTNTGYCMFTASSISLAGVADKIRFTTSNGTDQFTAGSINIQYE